MMGFLDLLLLVLGAATAGTGALAIRADSPVGWITLPLSLGFMAWALIQQGKR